MKRDEEKYIRALYPILFLPFLVWCPTPFVHLVFILQDSRSLTPISNHHRTRKTRDPPSFQTYFMWSKWLGYVLLGRALCTVASPTAFAGRDTRSLSVELLDVLEHLAGSQPVADISRLGAAVKAKSPRIDPVSDP